MFDNPFRTSDDPDRPAKQAPPDQPVEHLPLEQPAKDHPVKRASFSPDMNSERLARVEKKVSILVALALFQSLLLGAWMLTYILPRFLVYIQVLMVFAALVALAYFFRKQIPGWAGSFARTLFGFLDDSHKKV